MNGIYIVFENKTTNYLPEPIDPKLTYPSGTRGFFPSPGMFKEPRFDPIMPNLDSEGSFVPRYPDIPQLPKRNPRFHDDKPNIICVCKDKETAEQFAMNPNRYILGPFTIM